MLPKLGFASGPKLGFASGPKLGFAFGSSSRSSPANGFLVPRLSRREPRGKPTREGKERPDPSDEGLVEEYVLNPAPRGPQVLRIVGPGRRERAYQERVGSLERELEAASLVERGSARRLDRMERKLDAVREAALDLEQKEKRLILALGALQRENELLRERLALALPAPRRSLLARLL